MIYMKALTKLWAEVRTFHLAFNQPAPERPTIQPLAAAEKRGEWIRDECDELDRARTLVDQADAYLDIIYFGIGGLVELGLDPHPLWEIVHGANMAKLHNGKPCYHPDGKVKKPEGWVAPEPQLKAEVERQLNSTLVNEE